MKYLVKTTALWTQHRDDIKEVLYNETVDVVNSYALVKDEVSLKAIIPRGYDLAMEVKDGDRRTLSQLITAHKKLIDDQEAETPTAPVEQAYILSDRPVEETPVEETIPAEFVTPSEDYNY